MEGEEAEMSSTLSESAAYLAWLQAVPPRRWSELVEGDPLDLAMLTDEQISQASQQIAAWAGEGMRFATPGSPHYPRRLLRCPSPPPFLFFRGEVRAEDERAVAIIGTRECTVGGARRAERLARELAEAGVTVVSGLALGIDTAAHCGALLATSGRTVAVVGTGLDTIYPAENRELHERICRNGAVLSQFMPGFRGQRGGANFLARNRTMADFAQATVVVEASLKSGARSQAVYAQKRGGPLLLLRSLVETEGWAAEMAELPGCFVVSSLEDVLRHLSSAT